LVGRPIPTTKKTMFEKTKKKNIMSRWRPQTLEPNAPFDFAGPDHLTAFLRACGISRPSASMPRKSHPPPGQHCDRRKTREPPHLANQIRPRPDSRAQGRACNVGKPPGRPKKKSTSENGTPGAAAGMPIAAGLFGGGKTREKQLLHHVEPCVCAPGDQFCGVTIDGRARKKGTKYT